MKWVSKFYPGVDFQVNEWLWDWVAIGKHFPE